MAHRSEMWLVAVSVFFLVVGPQPIAAQSGKGTGTGNTAGNTNPAPNPNTNMGTNTRLPGAQPSPDSAIRDVVLTGNVVTADGSPPPELVAIEQVCNTRIVRLGYTDTKGFFSFQLSQPVPVMQDASASGRISYSAPGMLTANASDDFDKQSAGSRNALWALVGCELRGLLAGYQSTSVMIRATPSIGPTNVGTIVLLRAEKQGSTVSATSLNAPKDARRAYEKAAAHIRKRKLTEAQKELEQAVKLYPRYAAAWADLGWVYEQQNRLAEARAAFIEGRKADDNFVPPYLGLASAAIRESKWTEAQELSARAAQLDGADFPLGFHYNAIANLQLGHLDQAEKSARLAKQLDVHHTLPEIKLLLGTILAMKRDYAAAGEELALYLKAAPNAANAEKIRQRVAELKKLSESPATPADSEDLLSPVAVAPGVQSVALRNWDEITRLAGNTNPLVLVPPQNWAPPDIDESVPPVTPGVPCPVHEILTRVSARAKELLDNLREFSATERIEHLRVNKAGNEGPPLSATFKYVAEVREDRSGFDINEYRDGSSSKQFFAANFSTTGTAAHALMFHPSLIDNLTITCEGLGSVRGQPAWQLHFAQRPDRPPRFREYHTNNGTFRVELKGRAWATTDSYQVMRMETDLAKPIAAIALRKDHIIIDYRPVEFPKRHTQLWLPETADLYLDFLGQRSHRRHSFSDFELFSVDLAEKTRDPKAP